MVMKCDPCDCPEQYYRDSQSWRKAMITLLCDVEAAIGNIGSTPRVLTTLEKLALPAPTAGLLVFDSTLNKLSVYNGATWETVTSV